MSCQDLKWTIVTFVPHVDISVCIQNDQYTQAMPAGRCDFLRTLASTDHKAIGRATHTAPDHMAALSLPSVPLNFSSFNDIEHDNFIRCRVDDRMS